MGRVVAMQESDFIANALIEADQNYKKNYVTKKQLEAFKIAVAAYLKASEDNILLCESWGVDVSSEKEDIEKYFLIILKSDEGVLYFLKEGITISMLWNHFRGRLSMDIQKAFMAEDCYKCLSGQEQVLKLNS